MKKVALALLLPLPAISQSTTFAPEAVVGVGDGPSCVYAADLDGDGDLDVISCEVQTARVGFYLNLGGGNFGPQQVLTNTATNPAAVFATDLDGDGDADILFASTHGPIRAGWFRNLGGSNFSSEQSVAGTINNFGVETIYAADLDGDGDTDVIWAGNNMVAWNENLGGGIFGPHQQITAAVDTPTSVYAADLDGDGDLDVLSASGGDDKIAFYVNNGSGLFSTQFVISAASINPQSVTAADFDGDGDLDVLSGSVAGNKVEWFENLGFGFFGAANILPIFGYGAWSVCASDIDNDGDADVVWGSAYMNKIGWHENLGGGVFGVENTVANNAPFVTSVVAADLDGDGDNDVLTANLTGDTISLYENLLPPPPLTSTSAAFGAGCGSPPMHLAPTSTAVLGTPMTSTITNTPTPLCVIAIGLSNTDMPPLSLPFDMTGIGMTGCTLYQSAEVFGLGTSFSGQPFVMNWSYPTPGDVAALGVRIYTQAFSYAPGANPLEIIASNGIDWLIGNQ